MQYAVSRSSRVLVLAFLASTALACSSRGTTPRGDSGPPTPFDAGGSTTSGDIRVEPADVTATITGGVPFEQDYRAFLMMPGGAEREVTTEVTWTVTAAPLGAFAAAHFTSATDLGGRTLIVAQLGSSRGQTSLTLRLERVIVAPGTPTDAPSLFTGADDPSRAPELVYPDDGVVVPPNMRELEFHYRTGGSTVFELSFDAPAISLRVYFGCPESVGGGCAYTPDDEVWDTLAMAARGTGPTTYRLRGSDGSRVGGTAERRITFAEEDITGGLYYWAATSGAIKRYEWGRRGSSAETFLDRARTGAFMCVGCHALSRDGSRIALGTDIPTTTFQVFDVASRVRVFQQGGGGGPFGFPSQMNFSAFSPDSSQIVQSGLAGLRTIDGTTGTTIEERLGGGPGAHPDWSPNGEQLVFARHDAPSGFGLVDVGGITDGRITILDRAGGAWGPPRVIAENPGQNNYYPAFSPDGQWVVYNHSPSNTNSMGGDPDMMISGVPDAQTWLVRTDGGAPPIRLDTADGLADSWPKWDPTSYLDQGRPLFWLAWSSRRAYGLRIAADVRVQLWMTAVRVDAATGGMDPSAPAFWIPFQEIDTGNHIPQWVTHVDRMGCVTDMDCGGEFCSDGVCYPELI